MHAYEPTIADGPERGGRAPLDFTVGEALDAGWRGVRAHGVTLGAAFVLAGLPSAVVGVALRVGFGPARFGSREYWLRAAIGVACGEVLGALFRAGLLRMAIAAARGEVPDLRELGRGVRLFVPMLLLGLLSAGLLVASAPLLLVPYAYVWLGLALSPYFLAEGRPGDLRGAMRASWAASHGERLHLLGFYVAAEVVRYLGLAACCVGSLVAVPLASVATAYVYLRLAGERVTGPDDDE